MPNLPAPWPDCAEPHFRDVEVAISRTEPPYAVHAAVQEVETLFDDMIASASRTIYVESQYLTSARFARALAKAMRRRPELEAVIVGPYKYRGKLERTVMTAGRARVARILRQARVADRVLLAAPRIVHDGKPADPHVHSKVMIVDDRYLRVGSANLCHRSMGTDTECDLSVAAGDDDESRASVLKLRDTLIAEHAGATLEEVQAAIAQHGSIIAAIKSLPRRDHWLQEVADRSLPVSPPSMWEYVADPRTPIDPTRLLSEGGAAIGRSKRRPMLALAGILLTVAFFLGLAAAWRLTPLAEFTDPDVLVSTMAALRGPLAILAVILVFVALGLVMFPVMVLIAVTAAVFGVWPGMLYAAAGALASAMVTYAIGRWLGPHGLRQFFGPRLNLITRSFAHKGIPTVTLVRLVPVAPFSIVNLTAGAISIPALDYILGTALGLLPGIAIMSVLGDRAIRLIQQPSLAGVAALVGLLVTMVGISIGLQMFIARRRRAEQTRRPGRRLLRETMS